MKILNWTLSWNNENMVKTLQQGLAIADYFVFVQKSQQIKQHGNFLEKMVPWFISMDYVSQWPGTISYSDAQTKLFKYQFCQESLDILCEYYNDLFIDANSGFEDFSLLRSDGTPWLITITHEHEAYFKVCKDEINLVNSICDMVEWDSLHEDMMPEERY